MNTCSWVADGPKAIGYVWVLPMIGDTKIVRGQDLYLGMGLCARFRGLNASEPRRGLFIFGMCQSILYIRVLDFLLDTNSSR